MKKIKKILPYLNKNDIILIVILSFIALIVTFNNIDKSNKIVEIYQHGNIIGKYSINKDKTISISKDIIVEIKDSKVRMKKNNCRNQLCVKQGFSDSIPIICLPNEIEIVIKGKKTDVIRKIIK